MENKVEITIKISKELLNNVELYCNTCLTGINTIDDVATHALELFLEVEAKNEQDRERERNIISEKIWRLENEITIGNKLYSKN